MYEFLQCRVREAMTPHPVTISPDIPLRELERLFEAHNFNGVPVVDEQGHLLGLATKLDLLAAFKLNAAHPAPHYEEIMAQPVKTVLMPDPVTIDPEQPLSRVLQQLVEMRVKSFPVVKEGRLVGIVSREDVMKALRLATTGQAPCQEIQS